MVRSEWCWSVTSEWTGICKALLCQQLLQNVIDFVVHFRMMCSVWVRFFWLVVYFILIFISAVSFTSFHQFRGTAKDHGHLALSIPLTILQTSSIYNPSAKLTGLHCAECRQLSEPEWHCQVELLQENVIQKRWGDFTSFPCGPYCCSRRAVSTHLRHFKPMFSMMFALMSVWAPGCKLQSRKTE